jgi:hypothetical protein
MYKVSQASGGNAGSAGAVGIGVGVGIGGETTAGAPPMIVSPEASRLVLETASAGVEAGAAGISVAMTVDISSSMSKASGNCRP